MKQLVLNMALLIMAQKGSTSTLEVKNGLFDVFLGEGNPNGIGHQPIDPSFRTSQKEISDLMAELYVENNWERSLNKTGQHQFYEYQLPAAVGVTLQAPNQPANVPAANVIPVVAFQPSLPTATFVSKKVTALDPNDGAFVAYVAGHPEKFCQGNDPKILRRDCFQKHNSSHIGLVYDDIRRCKVEYFNKHHA